MSAIGRAIDETLRNPPTPTDVVTVLQAVHASELFCVARYKGEYAAACRLHGANDAAGFLEYAREEWHHAERVRKRICELGGAVVPPPVDLNHIIGSASDGSLERLAREDVIVERMVCATYARVSNWVRPIDGKTATLIDEILAEEREHAGIEITEQSNDCSKKLN